MHRIIPEGESIVGDPKRRQAALRTGEEEETFYKQEGIKDIQSPGRFQHQGPRQ